MKRAALHAPSFSRPFRVSVAGSGPPREDGQRIAALVSARSTKVKPGWHLPPRPLCACAMAAEQEHPEVKRLDELFAAEPDRLSQLSFEVGGLYFDWSKTHLDQPIIDEFLARAERMGLATSRDALFSGEIVNRSEARPATHVAERGGSAAEEVDLAAARRQRLRALIDAIEVGAFGDVTGVLHIGIGGSVLGPALLVDALGRRTATLNVRFLSNIDGAAFDDAVKPLDPATTLVVVASKTFTTLETLANQQAGR